MNSLYSFDDTSVTFSHAAVGQYVASGKGIGSLGVSMATDRSVQDVAADGSVMTSKIKGRNGTLSVSAQQTSDLHKWLLKLYNYLETAPTNQWAGITIVVRSPSMQDKVTATGVAFQKIPDRQWQAQGQQLMWTLLAADIQQDVA